MARFYGVSAAAVALSASSVPHVAEALKWTKGSIPLAGGAVLTDVHAIFDSSSSDIIAYASGEAGVLLKLRASTSEPEVWQTVLDLSFPFYFYGVYSFDANTTMLSGFIDGSQGAYGIIQYTRDGGNTWTNDSRTSDGTWAGGPIEFAGQEGLMLSTSADNVWRTSTGGESWSDWAELPCGDGQWHAGPYVWGGDGQAWVAGSALCHSKDYGSTWTCGPAIDESGMDSGLACYNQTVCIVGGGEISPSVAGWVHVSTGGPVPSAFNATRALQAAFPIRAVQVIGRGQGQTPVMIAAGGNYFSGVGGIYSSLDLGMSWTLDVNLEEEIKACRALALPGTGKTRVWCVSAGKAGASIVSADI